MEEENSDNDLLDRRSSLRQKPDAEPREFVGYEIGRRISGATTIHRRAPARGDYRPKSFIPKLNPFYIALPFNDVTNHTIAPRVVPWHSKRKGKSRWKSVCRGQWVAIKYGKRICYAQWEGLRSVGDR